MNSSEILTTLFLSIRIGVIATALNLPLALILVYWMTRHDFRGKNLLDGLINLPLVMPPVTPGYLLLLILGKRGWIGSIFFSLFGLRIAFTTAAAVIASMVVSFPLIVRSIRISMEMVDPRLEKAALTLGADRKAVFFRITLPLVIPGVINGVVLGFARSLGEFGATVTFAGNIQGITRTIPLSVYSLLQVPGRENEAGLLVLFSILISFAAMFASAFLNSKLQKGRHKQHESSF
ncbi:molybdate ABC transporter permease subunit [Oceanispirochaeta sp.]|jgi:molybdate transport system permease protein|uniref:molybdate ABC transporter permease subunit n=1 Tax=Oceanispirochaeta sp. TaxID=2035350 RepID=UPI002616F16D|nr:molybdate ABC transporter permease subunit [Oceanispirochaeta sp.]MDA3955929.1 molybdate ABC transporter permease subunit [Oceanispirochaeta sp.]